MIRRLLTGVLLTGALCGCGTDTDPNSPTSAAETDAAAPHFDDLDGMQSRGVLRAARPAWQGYASLREHGLTPDAYHRVAEEFAALQGLTIAWTDVAAFEDLFTHLEDGLVDLVVADATVTRARAEIVAFTEPVGAIEEWVLTRRADATTGDLSVADVAGLSFGVIRGHAHVESFDYFPELVATERVTFPADTTPEALVGTLLGDGAFDAVVLDAPVARWLLAANEGLQHVYTLPRSRPIAWATRPGNPQLLDALNDFLSETRLVGQRSQRDPQDLNGIRESGRLRMLTVSGPNTIFLWRGELLGFEYELLRRLAETIGVQLEVVLAPSREALIPWLIDGRGDLVSAAMTATTERRQQGVTFSTPYLLIDELAVTHRDTPAVESLADLAGRRVVANPGSSHWQTLTNLGVVPEAVEVTTEAILAGISERRWDVTVTDSHLLDIERVHDDSLVGGWRVKTDVPIAWAVAPAHTELVAALNAFIDEEYRGLHYNILVNKYFRNERRIRKQEAHRVSSHQLSPYDELVRSHAATVNLDWRLVVAQMYQESRFNPKQTSFAGARGLMQVMPRTARQVGLDAGDLWQPEVGIEAGVRYMDWVRDRFPSSLPDDQLMWFSLAAYNAGAGHVHDARRLAAELGLDRNRWFDNVELAMLKLAEPEYARNATYGFVRGREPVKYVREIRDRYEHYIDHFRVLGTGGQVCENC